MQEARRPAVIFETPPSDRPLMKDNRNQQVILHSRRPISAGRQFRDRRIRIPDLRDGEMLVRNLYLSSSPPCVAGQ